MSALKFATQYAMNIYKRSTSIQSVCLSLATWNHCIACKNIIINHLSQVWTSEFIAAAATIAIFTALTVVYKVWLLWSKNVLHYGADIILKSIIMHVFHLSYTFLYFLPFFSVLAVDTLAAWTTSFTILLASTSLGGTSRLKLHSFISKSILLFTLCLFSSVSQYMSRFPSLSLVQPWPCNGANCMWFRGGSRGGALGAQAPPLQPRQHTGFYRHS